MTDRPIFILGIQRGGTNQILNVLRSHPDTFWPQGEFHEVFKSRGLRKDGWRRWLSRRQRYAPIRRGVGDIFDPERKPSGTGLLAGARGEAVRAGLEDSARVNAPSVARYKQALADHGLIDPGKPDRMLCKVMNYNLLFAEDFHRLYPEATFVGVIRDGRGVCEGNTARGASVAAAAAAYDFVGSRLIELEKAGLPIRTWRFEDLLTDAATVAREIHAFCGLDAGSVRGVCLQDKERVTNDKGRIVAMRKIDKFYTFEEMSRHMRQDANATSLSRLSPDVRDEVLERCKTILQHFGYV